MTHRSRDMVTRQDHPIDWSTTLNDSLWFHIGQYLTIHDIHRLSRTCSRLQTFFTSHHFWSYLIRQRFGLTTWQRFVRNATPLRSEDDDDAERNHLPHSEKPCRSRRIYFQLIQRQCISFADFHHFSFDANRTYRTISDASSLTGHVLAINDSVALCYSLRLETIFRDILPGTYDVIWRMRLELPYMLGATEFIAVVEQVNPGQTAYTRWTQDDFLSMYRCFNCDYTKTNLWFYQTTGTIEVLGPEPCHVHVAMINDDPAHAKHGICLDYVELKRQAE